MTEFYPFQVRVPASTSNLGSGFDTLSAALSLYLTVRVEAGPGSSVEWKMHTPLAPDENILAAAFLHACRNLNLEPPGLRVSVDSPIPLQRGLGSSAAAIIAGVKMAERLSGRTLGRREIFDLAFPLEGHPDNLAASLLGGWVLSRVEEGRMRAVRLDPVLECSFVAAIPETAVSTQEARRILPDQFPLQEAVFNLQRVALMVYALTAGRRDLVQEAVKDRLHQPCRAALIPGGETILERKDLPSIAAPGLLGVCISGSGASMVALADDELATIGKWMVGKMNEAGGRAEYRILQLDLQGAVARSL